MCESHAFSPPSLLAVQLQQDFGIDVHVPQLKRRIHHLLGAQYLQGYRFVSVDGSESNTIAIRLGWRGVGVLKSMANVFPQKTGYLASIANDPVAVKKILAAAQFVVRSGVLTDSVSFAKTVCQEGPRNPKAIAPIVRPHAAIQSEGQTIFVESVRSDPGFEQGLLEKLRRYNLCCKAKNMNLPLHNPVVVLVAESAENMRMVMQTIANEHFDFQVIFSGDVNIYEDVSNSLYKLPEKAKKPFFARLLAG